VNESGDEDVSGIQVDLYGVKLKTTPRPAPGEEPQTWRQVARGINRDLMSVVSNTFSFLADIFRAARSLVRGIGGLSTLMTARVNRAHEETDSAEVTRAEIFSDPPPVEESLRTVQRLLSEKRVQGLTGEAFADPTGEHIVFCFLPPMDQKDVERVAAAALALALPEQASRALEGAKDSVPGEVAAKPRKRRRRRKKKSNSS
jgi:hypothetical protein